MKKLIVITTPHFFCNEGEILSNLFMEGMSCLHLRKPNADRDTTEALIKGIPSTYYSRIVLHDNFELATTYQLKGIHLNKRNSTMPTGFSGSISCSCHSLDELSKNKKYDYQFLSPIFKSISKEGYGSGFPLEELFCASEKGLINEQTIALGGLDATTILLLKDIHFGGVAVLGALWGISPFINGLTNIIEQFKLLQLCLNTH